MSSKFMRKRLASVEKNSALKDSRGYILRYGLVEKHEFGSDYVGSILLRDPRNPQIIVTASDLRPLPFQKSREGDYLKTLGVNKRQIPFIPRERLEEYYSAGGAAYAYLEDA
ncbi:hypothetical protein [Sulfitobacter sp. M22]|uniref:hypothetical protein n=1 Tax=Sulfitobacter sp. M22 TaxID=2675332 RepID=UPI001F2BF732|nr:hypothetical protein [Sulfitobacter sp. M22]MCF7728677.1 hypothetical protein [Sulfitobacter sp. M22]